MLNEQNLFYSEKKIQGILKFQFENMQCIMHITALLCMSACTYDMYVQHYAYCAMHNTQQYSLLLYI